jgi:hypothetical protein
MVISSLKGLIATWNGKIFKISDYRYRNHVIILDNAEARKLLDALQQYIAQSEGITNDCISGNESNRSS